MKDHQGRAVIRLGDKTSHGGEVISACDSLKAMGKAVALEADMTFCPKCKGQFAIQPGGGGSTRKHHGKQVAYHGDTTACGATLIATL
ncbi:PAAR domain-containing protein [uncultured Herbaspirillum sp.]|uniref:PAAR domain-containing protein n=1 Tax=uncultured Herbaspirillum sp. TaxID=160236 RepID=UPI002639C247|nr:PAAR domain-containing protein [uncultured Herbaspirillum sp.]